MLIQLDEKYYLKNDSDKSYVICSQVETKDKEGNAVISYPSIGYYTTIDAAVISYCNKVAMQTDVTTFKEFIDVYTTTKNSIVELFKETQNNDN